LDTNYRPYFFSSHPITKEDSTVIRELGVKTRVENKTDLFTGQNVKLTRIALEDFSDHLQISRKFSKSWQNEVSTVSSYIYDKGLAFGAQYDV